MSSRLSEIQNLIADIDRLLTHRNNLLSRFISHQESEPRQVLERIRSFLVTLATEEESGIPVAVPLEHRSQSTPASPLLEKFATGGNYPPLLPNNLSSSQRGGMVPSTQTDFSLVLQPLQAELQDLLQHRANLVDEIRQLEQKRLHNYSLAQQLANQEQMISEFLRVLMSRLTGNMPTQVMEPRANLQLLPSPGGDIVPTTNVSTPAVFNSPERVEKIARLVQDLDQRLLALDGTVNVVFESLQRNIHNYHDSLSQGLSQMHSKGAEGEEVLINFVENLQRLLEQQNISSQQPSSVQADNVSSLVQQPDIESDAEVPQDNISVPPEAKQEQEQAPIISGSTNTESLQTQEVGLRGDGVDQIYASFFGIDEVGVSPIQNPESQFHHQEIDDFSDIAYELNATLPESSLVSPSTVDTVDTVDNSFDDSLVTELGTPEPQEDEVVHEEETSFTPNAVNPELQIRDRVSELPIAPVEVPLNSAPVQSEPVAETPINPAPVQNEPVAKVPVNPAPVQSEPVAETPINSVPVQSEDVEEVSVNPLPVQEEVPVNPVPVQINTVSVPDPWFEQDSELVDITFTANSNQTLETTKNPNATDTVNTPNTSQANQAVNPESSDRIKSLTDLLVDEESATVTPIPEENSPDTVSGTQEQNLNWIDDFIPASPKENLLPPKQGKEKAVPKISLNTEQLQQLEVDLANFDRDRSTIQPEADFNTPQLQPLPPVVEDEPKLDLNPLPEQLPPVVEDEPKLDLNPLPEQLPQVTEDEPQLDLNPPKEATSETVNKIPATIETKENPLLSVFKPVNKTNISLNNAQGVWYIGIDIGSTGISAALLNRSTTEIYPIYWSAAEQPEPDTQGSSFRLPAEVYLPKTVVATSDTKNPSQPTHNLFSAHLKPYLQIALPFKQDKKWEPVVEFNQYSTLPLVWVVRSLSKLLSTLKCDRSSTTPGLVAAAVGIEADTFHDIIENIAGVICNFPSSWSEQYRFNIREALLACNLVQHPQQVFFVEEAIATLLSELDSPEGEMVKFSVGAASRAAKTSDSPLFGNTLTINIGATFTEMALVDLPESLLDLTHNDFMLHDFAYAGKGIDQDIICQLLLPSKWRSPRNQTQDNSKTSDTKPWHWQPSIPGLEQVNWESLQLDDLELPRVGEPDTIARIMLQQRLESTIFGKALLDAAIALKLILQHQDSFTLELADQRWVLQRKDLETQIFVPFVRRLNRELNKLLVARGIPTEAINQAILTGGVASVGAISRWLRQKLPNAKIIQDSYLHENGTPICSRVAYGLAMLPLHPLVVDIPRQQYTDYFLFTELLRLLPDRALSFNEVIQLFENRGINTRSCQERLLAFLEGELPPGLLPHTLDFSWLTQKSQENSHYQAIAAAPLFTKQDNLTYRPHPQHIKSLLSYLDAIKASTQQSLEEPYTVNFALGVSL